MIHLGRRAFIGLIAGAGAVAVAVCVSLFPLAPDQRLRQLIRSRLDYMDIPEPVLDAFVRDYKNDIDNRMRHIGTIRYVAQRAAYSVPALPDRLPIYKFERHIISQFLQSTDFFRRGADVEQPLRYVRYCDPYRLGCANYFAKLG
jgi:hypothetical protein